MNEIPNRLLYIGEEPTRAHHDDAGFDLEVEGDHEIEPHGFYDLPLRTRIKSPAGQWSLLVGRSSTFRNRKLLVGMGVIDPGYVGPLFAVVHNMTDQPVKVCHRERVAQLIPMNNVAQHVTAMRVQQLPDTVRSDNGFGSTGA